MSKHDLTHARHDPAHCLAPGLFRSLKRGERKRGKLDVTYTFGEGESMRFVGFEPLGADDMRLLQGIVALGGPNGILLTPEPTTETGQQLRLFWSEPQTGFTSGLPTKAPKPEPINHWQRAVQAIDEAIIEARHNPETARSLFALASYGRRDPASLEQLRATFAKEGIATEFLSHYEPDGSFACLRQNDGLSDKF